MTLWRIMAYHTAHLLTDIILHSVDLFGIIYFLKIVLQKIISFLLFKIAVKDEFHSVASIFTTII